MTEKTWKLKSQLVPLIATGSSGCLWVATASLGVDGLQLDTMANSTVALMAVMNVQAAVDPCPTRVLSGELVLISLVASQGNNVNLPTWVVTESSMHGG
ncbi:hypothetical protein ACH5RR_003303 [Cinchona calisaya]|uniref:Uncharacterized protein n=1 Tax=Cinchona calisaya TaxID=153742 RepID=A0ABD3AUF0_9GENT